MLIANNKTVNKDDVSVIVPPKEEDKELLRRVADSNQENGKSMIYHYKRFDLLNLFRITCEFDERYIGTYWKKIDFSPRRAS